MPKCADPQRHWRRLHEWPDRYRVLWLAATEPEDDLDAPNYGRSLRPESLVTIARNFGRWLNFLDVRGELDDRMPPEEMVTPARVADYLREFKELNYSKQSIILALSGLSCAMKILAPGHSWRWLWQPNGVKLAPYLKGRRKEFPIPHPSELYRWGLELLTHADAQKRSRNRLAQYRDGLMICLLAGRAIRRRSFAAMRIDEHLFRGRHGWRLKFEPAEIKNNRWIEVSVPKTLAPWISRYLTEIRPALLRRKKNGVTPDRVALATTALWVSADGTALAEQALTMAIWNRSGRKFTEPFATHRFRHAVGSYAPVDDPEHPGIATSLLAIGARMHEKHYNRAQDHIAETKFHDALAKERSKALSLARRLLAERDRNTKAKSSNN